MQEIIKTMGVDVGGSYVKVVLMAYDHYLGEHRLLDKQTEKIRKRNPKDVVVEAVDMILSRNQLNYDQHIAYLASTGEGEMVVKKTGHFYSMTSHARGGIFFDPEVKTHHMVIYHTRSLHECVANSRAYKFETSFQKVFLPPTSSRESIFPLPSGSSNC